MLNLELSISFFSTYGGKNNALREAVAYKDGVINS
jgi:hypothetical protein